MERLHLLGFTTDLEGVVFARRKGAKTASFWVPVDDSLKDAIEKLERARQEADADDDEDFAPPAEEGPVPRVHLPAVGRSQATSRIPTSEIQQLLRQGRTIDSVAKAARVSRAWVERLDEPVQVEREGVVRLAQRAILTRPRLGPSGLPVGQAVRANLEERKATADTLDALDDGWDARALRSGPWRVRLRFRHRGQRRTAEWAFVKSTRTVTARNRLASELGWWPSEEEPEEPEDEREEGTSEATDDQAAQGQPDRKPVTKRKPQPGAKRKASAKRKTPKREASKRRGPARGKGTRKR